MLVAFSNGRVFSTSMLRKRGRSTPSNPGRVWMPPIWQGDFFGNISARRFYRSCVRPLVVACCAPRAGMQFEEQGPHRFRELGWLEPRDWLSPF